MTITPNCCFCHQNVYLSKHGCTKFAHQDSIAYIENPDLVEYLDGRSVFCKLSTSYCDTYCNS